jgi:hypothetical protein
MKTSGSKRVSFFQTVIAWMAIASFILSGPLSFVAEAAGTTKITHKPVKSFVPNHRIQLTAGVTDPAGVKLVRCYFRAKGLADFVFVDMQNNGAGYSGILPSPSENTATIEYLFLAVNNSDAVVKTQTFVMNKSKSGKVPAWQQVDSTGTITLKTELAQAPKQLAGFTDNILMDIVESTVRFGVVAGIYAGSASAGATAATSVTTVSAAAGGGIGMGTVLLGAAVVGGGAAAAGGLGGGSDSGGSGGGGGTITPTTPASALVGTWNVTEQTQPAWSMNGTLNSGGTCNMTEWGVPWTGTWSFNGSTMYFTLSPDGGGGAIGGTISGNTDNFYVDGHYAGGTPGYFHWVRQ